MEMKRSIRVTDLVCFLAVFEIGSTTLFFLGAEAKRDAWIAMGIAALFGLLLLTMYLIIYRSNPELDLYDLCRRNFGKILGPAINLGFTGYFAYEASRNLRDMGELAKLTLLDRTPLMFIMLITIIVVSNTVRYGPYVVVLLVGGFLPFMIFSYSLIYALLVTSGLIRLDLMLPILEEGVRPVWTAAVPELISFPFGQTLLFLLLFPLVNKRRKLGRSVILAYSITAIGLIMINQINVLVLGPTQAANSTLPLLQVVQLIEIAEAFERFDVLFVIVLVMGLGSKMAAFFMGASMGLQKVTGLSYKLWTVILGICIYAMAFISPNYPHHIQLGIKIVVTYITPIFQVVLPSILLLLIWIRSRRRKQHQ